MSADYNNIVKFFEDLDLYLNRLKILEKSIPPVAELKLALAEVLRSVLVLCGICAKYVKMKRFGNSAFPPTSFFFTSFVEISPTIFSPKRPNPCAYIPKLCFFIVILTSERSINDLNAV